jgi:hypothetical protein
MNPKVDSELAKPAGGGCLNDTVERARSRRCQRTNCLVASERVPSRARRTHVLGARRADRNLARKRS